MKRIRKGDEADDIIAGISDKRSDTKRYFSLNRRTPKD